MWREGRVFKLRHESQKIRIYANEAKRLGIILLLSMNALENLCQAYTKGAQNRRKYGMKRRTI